MAELLIKANPARGKDRARAERFDPIEWRPDGGDPWGIKERAKGWIIKLPEEADADLDAICKAQTDDDDGVLYFENLGSAEPAPGAYRFRAFGLDLTALTPGQRNRLARDGELTLSRGQYKRLFRRKRDSKRFDEI